MLRDTRRLSLDPTRRRGDRAQLGVAVLSNEAVPVLVALHYYEGDDYPFCRLRDSTPKTGHTYPSGTKL